MYMRYAFTLPLNRIAPVFFPARRGCPAPNSTCLAVDDVDVDVEDVGKPKSGTSQGGSDNLYRARVTMKTL